MNAVSYKHLYCHIRSNSNYKVCNLRVMTYVITAGFLFDHEILIGTSKYHEYCILCMNKVTRANETCLTLMVDESGFEIRNKLAAILLPLYIRRTDHATNMYSLT